MDTYQVNEIGPTAHYFSPAQKPLITAMLEPSFYAKSVSEIGHQETHASHLFFVEDLVYKIKKAVRFSFLDFSTVARRKFFLQEELRLNRRLAPSVYLGVLPISHENVGWQLGSDVRPVEYTLVMRRLPEKRMLDALLRRGQVTSEMMRSVAEILASFHAQAATGGKINGGGSPIAINSLWEENLADIQPFARQLMGTDSFTSLSEFGPAYVAKHKELVVRRVLEGRIREVHGDLHCEHICFAPEGIQIFDCVEFNPKLRYCDVASEVAFLVMDMEFHGAKDLARDFLARYQELRADEQLSVLLPYYKCHRALVRGKVAALRSNGTSPEASCYFDYACRVRWEAFQPFLVLIAGVTGSGKSTLARELSQRLGMPIIGSDATRKGLAGISERGTVAPYEKGIYTPSMTQRTYAKLAEEAEKLVLQGAGGILDATFHRKVQRKAVLNMASKHNVPVAVIHCHGAEGVIQERLRKRAEEGRDLSDGRWEVYLQQRAAFEPLEEVAPTAHLILNTEADVSVLRGKVEQFLQQIFLREAVFN